MGWTPPWEIARTRETADPEAGDKAQEERQRKVVAMLDSDPQLKLACMTAPKAVPGFMVLTVAIRGKGVFDMHIPLEKYDGFNLLWKINEHTGTVTE